MFISECCNAEVKYKAICIKCGDPCSMYEVAPKRDIAKDTEYVESRYPNATGKIKELIISMQQFNGDRQ